MLNIIMAIYAILLFIGKLGMNIEKLAAEKDEWLYIKYNSSVYPEIGLVTLAKTLSAGEIVISFIGAGICAAINVAFAYWLISLIF